MSLAQIIDVRLKLEEATPVTLMRGVFAQGEALAHTVRVTLAEGGKAANLSGATVTGKWLRSGESEGIALTGSASGGVATLTTQAACYAIEGAFKLVVMLVRGSEKRVIFAGVGDVMHTEAGVVIDPGSEVPDIDTLLAEIANMREATAAATTAAATANQAAQNANDTAAQLGVIDDTAVNTINPWSSKNIVDRLCLPLTAEGNPVTLDHPVEGYPLDIVAHIEPYQEGEGDPSPENVRPIVVPETLELRRTGRNLLDYSEWKVVGMTNGTAVWENNGVTLTATKEDCYTFASFFIDVVEGETYTLSWENDSDVFGRVYVFFNAQIAQNVNALATNKKLTFTVPEGISFISFRVGVGYVNTTISYKNIMLNLGSTATPYEPYRGDTYTLPLPEGFAGGSVGNDGSVSGTWDILELDGSGGAWMNGVNAYVGFAYHNKPNADSAKISTAMCTHYKRPEWWVSTDGSAVGFLNALGESDIKGFNQILADLYESGTPVQIAYQIATPTHQTISPVVIPALPGENVITSNATTLDVQARADMIHKVGSMESRLAAIENNLINS